MDKLAKRTEDASHQKIRSEAIMNSMDEAILLCGSQNEIIFINRKAINVFTIQHKNFIGAKFQDIWKEIQLHCEASVSEEDGKEIEKILNSKPSLLSSTFTLSVRSPIELYLKTYTGPIYDDEHGYLGRIWKFEDQTAQVKLEEVKSNFISIASHQLRTPITSISGYLAMVADGDFGEVPENLKEPIDAVIKASRQMKDLINDLLNTSRLEAKRTVPEIKEFDLISLINKEVDNQIKQAVDKNIKIKVIGSEEFIVKSDPMMIEESIKNYLSNAIKYSRPNSTVTIKVEKSEKEITVSVADHGIGIPIASQEHLFEKMYRADNVLKENFEGTGLGLYYVKQMMSALNGKVDFESTEGRGSTFYFSFPRLL